MGSTTTTRRIVLPAAILLLALAGSALAQEPTVISTRISLAPPVAFNVQVQIDGQIYTLPVNLLWPSASKHQICVYDQTDPAGLIKIGLSVPSDGSGISSGLNCLIYTADAHLPAITIPVVISYKISVVYSVCGSDLATTLSASPGAVVAGGNTFICSGSFYAPAGQVSLTAIPFPGWIFVGWYSGLGNDSQAYINSATVTGPMGIYPRFVHARSLTVQSSPPGLQVLVDRSPFSTPYALDWGITTTHTLGGIPDQLDLQGKLWVFDSWDDGGAINHAYKVPDGIAPLTITAKYVPGQRVSFLTNPPGLSVTVDGRSNWLSNNFAWSVGSQHVVAAPLTQVDSNGNTYTFRSWSQGGSAAQTIVVPSYGTQDLNSVSGVSQNLNLQYTANYDGQSKITVVSPTPGVVIQVDGADCALPCTIQKGNGAQIRLTAQPSLKLTEDSRLDFTGWNDSGELARSLSAPAGPLTLTVNYKLRNRLIASITPPEGARVTTDPATSDGFYDAQSQVQLSIDTKLGFKFMNWDGDLTSNSRTITVGMAAPRSVRAVLDRVPALLDGAVKNAAGDTPLNAVAAGSIISIFGVNLAAEFLAGPDNPLAQTLGNVTVQTNGKVLPLLFVSPEQINAQLPPDLTDGAYTVTVHWEGKPDVSTGFTVARNAPGLFNTLIDGRAFGLFLHENGDPVTADSPAKRSENITLLGNGIGPFVQAPPEGFATSESPTSVLADAVKIVSGEIAIDPIYAGVAAGKVGLTAIRFAIGDSLPAASTVEIKLRVRDRESNTVLLPIE